MFLAIKKKTEHDFFYLKFILVSFGALSVYYELKIKDKTNSDQELM